jgi:exopolysaccharide biosynthesis polyprenyl glycosylphosphotransferase
MPSIVADLAGTTQLLLLGVIMALAEVDALGGRLDGRVFRVSEAVAFAVPAIILVPAFRSGLRHLVARGRSWAPRVIVVGSGWLVESVLGRLSRSGEAVVVGVIDGDGTRPGLLGGVCDLARLCERYQIDRVLITPSLTRPKDTLAGLADLDSSVAVSVIPEYFELLNFRSTVEELAGLPMVHVKPASLSITSRAAKRLLDIVASSLLIVVLVPFWIVVAVLIKRDSSGPIFFRQERLGVHRKPFLIMKFRTMCADAEDRREEVESLNNHPGTPMFKAKGDPRLTQLGPKLRRRHIDELPQLFNVLLGQMSLVGPRPFPTVQCDNLAPRRFQVRPGMTGLWQVSGRSDLRYEDLLYLDTVYVSSWSFWWDMRILMQTPKVFLDRAGDGSSVNSGGASSQGRAH